VPTDAPFELKPSPGKGWGAFATRPIERGAMILREKPLFVIQKPHEEITEQDLWTAFQQLIPRDKQQFLCLRYNASKPFRSMTEAFAENSFANSDDINPLGYGLFILLSRLNHSCIPNSKVPVAEANGESIANFAIRDIAAGEEITFCYSRGFELRTRNDRHRALRFECDCKACLIGTPFQELSDTRRTLIRGLQYLRLGIDMVGLGQKQGAASPIIFDPELRKAVETFSIPISSRLIYSLLVVYLLEEEGLLDDFTVERFRPGILQLAALFKTESNARIARVAIAQETWLEKLCMAFTLYGRADVADDEIAMLLEIVQGLSVNA